MVPVLELQILAIVLVVVTPFLDNIVDVHGECCAANTDGRSRLRRTLSLPGVTEESTGSSAQSTRRGSVLRPVTWYVSNIC